MKLRLTFLENKHFETKLIKNIENEFSCLKVCCILKTV